MSALNVALFAYNRPWHLSKTLESLAANHLAADVLLTIYCDGPKQASDFSAVESVRKIAKSCRLGKNVTVVERSENLGLAQSIITGVSEQCEKYGHVIVLEDDLLLSPYFLNYMKEALIRYENEEKVISIHGYCYPVTEPLPETFFLKGADCWGWATWKRAWALFEPSAEKLLSQLKEKNLEKSFNMQNSTDYMGMLRDCALGKNQSWAIRWRASAFVNDKLTLYPGKSLVQNIGFDNSGTHCSKVDQDLFKDSKVFKNQIDHFPGIIAQNEQALAIFVKFYKSLQPNLFRTIWRKVREVLC